MLLNRKVTKEVGLKRMTCIFWKMPLFRFDGRLCPEQGGAEGQTQQET